MTRNHCIIENCRILSFQNWTQYNAIRKSDLIYTSTPRTSHTISAARSSCLDIIGENIPVIVSELIFLFISLYTEAIALSYRILSNIATIPPARLSVVKARWPYTLIFYLDCKDYLFHFLSLAYHLLSVIVFLVVLGRSFGLNRRLFFLSYVNLPYLCYI